MDPHLPEVALSGRHPLIMFITLITDLCGVHPAESDVVPNHYILMQGTQESLRVAHTPTSLLLGGVRTADDQELSAEPDH